MNLLLVNTFLQTREHFWCMNKRLILASIYTVGSSGETVTSGSDVHYMEFIHMGLIRCVRGIYLCIKNNKNWDTGDSCPVFVSFVFTASVVLSFPTEAVKTPCVLTVLESHTVLSVFSFVLVESMPLDYIFSCSIVCSITL